MLEFCRYPGPSWPFLKESTQHLIADTMAESSTSPKPAELLYCFQSDWTLLQLTWRWHCAMPNMAAATATKCHCCARSSSSMEPCACTEERGSRSMWKMFCSLKKGTAILDMWQGFTMTSAAEEPSPSLTTPNVQVTWAKWDLWLSSRMVGQCVLTQWIKANECTPAK